MLHEGWNMTATDAAEEMEEVQHDIRKREDEVGQMNDIVSHESTRVCCSVRCKFIRHELLTKSNPKLEAFDVSWYKTSSWYNFLYANR